MLRMGIATLVAEVAPTSSEISARVCAVSFDVTIFTCRVPIAARLVPTLVLVVPLAGIAVSTLLLRKYSTVDFNRSLQQLCSTGVIDSLLN